MNNDLDFLSKKMEDYKLLIYIYETTSIILENYDVKIIVNPHTLSMIDLIFYLHKYKPLFNIYPSNTGEICIYINNIPYSIENNTLYYSNKTNFEEILLSLIKKYEILSKDEELIKDIIK